MNQKIKTRKEIVAISKSLKRKKKTVVTTNGSFDILHLGHIKVLQAAKKKGDVLIVILNTDKSVRMSKGPDRPINPQNDRAETIAALEVVDYVTFFDEINPKQVLAEIKPNIHVHGSDWGKSSVEREVIEKNGGKIEVVKLKKDYSTSKLLEKINLVDSKPDVKAVFIDRDGTINEDKQGYNHQSKYIEFTPFAIQALQKLSKSDYKIIIVTNQSGISRGFYTNADYQKLTRWFMAIFKKKKIRIDKIYHCPHHPKDKCGCRKPEIGMIEKAVKDFKINLNHSWLIGDSAKDVMVGREANIKTIKLGSKMKSELKLEPHFYAKNLKEAVNIILKK